MDGRKDVVVYNAVTRAKAEKLAAALSGKTYMKFETGVAPAGGSFDVVVGTRRAGTTTEDLREMVTHYLTGMVVETL